MRTESRRVGKAVRIKQLYKRREAGLTTEERPGLGFLYGLQVSRKRMKGGIEKKMERWGIVAGRRRYSEKETGSGVMIIVTTQKESNGG